MTSSSLRCHSISPGKSTRWCLRARIRVPTSLLEMELYLKKLSIVTTGAYIFSALTANWNLVTGQHRNDKCNLPLKQISKCHANVSFPIWRAHRTYHVTEDLHLLGNVFGGDLTPFSRSANRFRVLRSSFNPSWTIAVCEKNMLQPMGSGSLYSQAVDLLAKMNLFHFFQPNFQKRNFGKVAKKAYFLYYTINFAESKCFGHFGAKLH